MSIKYKHDITEACNFLHLRLELDDEYAIIQTSSRELFTYGTLKTVALQLEGAIKWRKLSESRQDQKENIEKRVNDLDLIVQFEDDGRCCIQNKFDRDLLLDGTLEQAQLVLSTFERF